MVVKPDTFFGSSVFVIVFDLDRLCTSHNRFGKLMLEQLANRNIPIKFIFT